MWLLDTSDVVLVEFVGAEIKKYAILSHTWRPKEEEVSFQDMREDREAAKLKPGYAKVQKCCEKAREDGYRYVWIDTCCIDKRSSAELSEAINSMYRWYQNAEVCYAYLADVASGGGGGFGSFLGDGVDAFSKSRWFKRGWTLQELIAPRYIQFLGQDWSIIGAKIPQSSADQELPEIRDANDDFLSKLTEITGIPKRILQDPSKIQQTAVAQRMAWAAQRETTREEDSAYALMGLFGVSMPILYGEGLKQSFKRLQLEILQKTPDQSLFVWRANRETSGLLAESPHDFLFSGLDFIWGKATLQSHSMTNLGLLINVPIWQKEQLGDSYVIALRCWAMKDGKRTRIWLFLRKVQRAGIVKKGSVENIYRRELCDTFELHAIPGALGHRDDIYVMEDDHYEHVQWIDSVHK